MHMAGRSYTSGNIKPTVAGRAPDLNKTNVFGGPKSARIKAQDRAGNASDADLKNGGLKDERGRDAWTQSMGFTQPDGQQGVELGTRVSRSSNQWEDVRVLATQKSAGSKEYTLKTTVYPSNDEYNDGRAAPPPAAKPSADAVRATDILKKHVTSAVKELGGRISG